MDRLNNTLLATLRSSAGWAARILTVAAVLLLGRSTAAAAVHESHGDPERSQSAKAGQDQLAYADLDDVHDDWGDDPPPRPE